MIEINGKVYRNLQEQVEKNKEDIEDIKDKDYNYDEAIAGIQEVLPYKQDKLTAGDNITISENVISANLSAEDEEYKTELVFEPDDAYLKYYDKDPENPSTYSWGLVQKCFDIERLNQKHLYAHNIQLNVKLKDAGVTSDDYTGRVNLTLYLTTSEQLDETTLKQRVQMATRVSATGYAIHTVTEHNYTVIGLVKYSDLISTDLEVDLVRTNEYAASGLISSRIGEITTFTDKVVTIY